jgi:hypothetical protein
MPGRSAASSFMSPAILFRRVPDYPILDWETFTFHRHPIAKFDISKTVQGDNRWLADTFVRNIYDIWVTKQFERICSVIDMLPPGLNFGDPDPPNLQPPNQESVSSRSGLSQQFENYSLTNEQAISESRPSSRQVTPDTTIQTDTSKPNKPKRRKNRQATCRQT